MIGEKLELINKARMVYENIITSNECVNMKMLNINGNDLIKLGFNQGKQIGDILNYLLEKVLENPELNKKEYLINLVKKEL